MIPPSKIQRPNSIFLRIALQRRLTVYTVKTYSSGTRSVWTKSNDDEEKEEEEEKDEDTDPQSPEGWSNIKHNAT